MEHIARPVPVITASGSAAAELNSQAAELTQSLRRLDRAIMAERVTQSMKAGKPVGTTPLLAELEKQRIQLENVRLAYGMKDEECGD